MESVRLSQSVAAAEKILAEFENRVAHLKVALARTTADIEPLQQQIGTIESSLDEVSVKLLGDRVGGITWQSGGLAG